MPNAKKMAEQAQSDQHKGSLRAARMFTDRKDLRDAYHELVERSIREDFEGYYVISYYGVGGVGKSMLLRKLRDEVLDKAKTDRVYQSVRHITLMLDFDRVPADMVSALEHLKAQLQRQRFSFPLFELALYALYEKNGYKMDGQDEQSFLDSNPLLASVLKVTQQLPVVGMAASLGEAAVDLAGNVRDVVRDLLQKRKGRLYEIEQMDENALRRNLPLLFAEDVNAQLKNDMMLHVFIDTYEMLVSEAKKQKNAGMTTGSDDWIWGSEGLIRNLGNAVFAVSGLEKLTWSRDDSFWKDRLETHLTGHLSEKDSGDFLESCGVPERLWHPLYELTDGVPVFLDLCVDRYWSLVGSGKTPTPEAFGGSGRLLVERYTRYLPENLHDAVYLLGGMRRWNREIFDLAASAAGIRVNPSEYEKILMGQSFIEDEGDGVSSMQRVIAGILASRLPEDVARKASAALAEFASGGGTGLPAALAAQAAMDLAGEQIRTMELARALDKQADEARKKLQYSRALDLWQRAYDIASVLAPAAPETVQLQRRLAEQLYNLGQYEAARKLYEELLAVIGEEFDLKYQLPLQVRRAIARCLSAQGQVQLAADIGQELYPLCEKKLGAGHPQTSLLVGELAGYYMKLGRYSQALGLQKWVYDRLKNQYGPNEPAVISVQEKKAICQDLLGKPKKALDLYEEAYRSYCDVLGPDHPNTLGALGNLAVCHRKLGERGQALKQFQTVYDGMRRILGPDHPNTLWAQSRLLETCFQMEEYGQALPVLEEIYETKRAARGAEDRETMGALANLADCLVKMGSYDQAQERYRQLYETSRRLAGLKDQKTLNTLARWIHCLRKSGGREQEAQRQLDMAQKQLLQEKDLKALAFLADKLKQLKEFEPAEELYKRVYEERKRSQGPKHPDTLQALDRLAYCSLSRGDARKAGWRYNKLGKAYGWRKDDPKALRALENLANCVARMGSYDQALKLATQVLEAREKLLGPKHPETLRAMEALAYYYNAAGDKEQAREMHKRLEELRKDSPEEPDKK